MHLGGLENTPTVLTLEQGLPGHCVVALGPLLPQLPKEPQTQGRHVGLPHMPRLPVLRGAMGSERGSTQPGQVSMLPAGADPGRNKPCSLGTL